MIIEEGDSPVNQTEEDRAYQKDDLNIVDNSAFVNQVSGKIENSTTARKGSLISSAMMMVDSQS